MTEPTGRTTALNGSLKGGPQSESGDDHLDADEPNRSPASDDADRDGSGLMDRVHEAVETATDAAGDVMRTAAEDARRATDLAKEQTAKVGTDVAERSRHLTEEAARIARHHAHDQAAGAGQAQTRIADLLTALVEKGAGDAGHIASYVRAAAERISSAADALHARGYNEMLQRVKSTARRRPGMFLAGAALAGFGIARMVRAALRPRADAGDGSPSAPMASPSQTHFTEAPGMPSSSPGTGQVNTSDVSSTGDQRWTIDLRPAEMRPSALRPANLRPFHREGDL